MLLQFADDRSGGARCLPGGFDLGRSHAKCTSDDEIALARRVNLLSVMTPEVRHVAASPNDRNSTTHLNSSAFSKAHSGNLIAA
jgi:hypothetical protein